MATCDEHKRIVDCLNKKMSKKTVLVVALSIGIPLFGVGAGVWSETRTMKDKYVTVREMEPHIKNIEASKTVINQIPKEIEKIQAGQHENAKGINDILKILIEMKNDR